jgi:hypothetical protein
MGFPCPHEGCAAIFSRRANRDRHYKLAHTSAKLIHNCSICGQIFDEFSKLKEHRLTHEQNTKFVQVLTAFSKTCVLYRKHSKGNVATLESCFKNDKDEIRVVLSHELNKKRMLKAQLIFHAEFMKPQVDALTHQLIMTPNVLMIRTAIITLHSTLDITPFLSASRLEAQGRIDDFTENGSGE